DLASLKTEEVIEFLRTWEPPADWMGASPEGLARELTSLVATDPVRFAEVAEQFGGLDPTYIRGVIEGCEEAAKNGVAFPWPNILKLSRWVSEQPRETEGRAKNRREADPDWGWTLKAISRLLIIGIESKTNPVPFELRAELWPILERLVEDPEPSEKSEREYL